MDPSVWLKVLIAFLPVWALAQQSPEGLEASTVTQKPEKYSVPLRFTPEDLGMSIKSYDMKWDLSHEGTLKMGPVSIDSKSLAVAFYKGDDKSNPLKKIFSWSLGLPLCFPKVVWSLFLDWVRLFGGKSLTLTGLRIGMR